MRALIACEYSGTVRDAFRKLGWYAMSCDLLPTDASGEHHQGDVRELMAQPWDIIIAFPPCTYLCSSGMHWTTRGLRDPNMTDGKSSKKTACSTEYVLSQLKRS